MGKFVREQQPILLPVLMGTKPFCISGYIVEHNEMGEVIHNSEKVSGRFVACYLPHMQGHLVSHP
uniref:Uncharacterized protein n=1 Tax=Klebsiella pneumoniae TaxID=573 RepID=A0A8B0SSD4_KLEPN|nr:hypothetical protein [Klebsiella pneumoniae]